MVVAVSSATVIDVREPTPVLCRCGEQLADGTDGERILLDGRWRPFRRRTDHLVCDVCFWSIPVRQVHAAHVELAGDG